jgi:hypothetical protein
MKNLLLIILTLFAIFNGCKSKSDSSLKNESESKPDKTETQFENFETPFYENYGIGKLKVIFENTILNKKTYVLNFYRSDSDADFEKKIEITWNESDGGFVETQNTEFLKVKDFYLEEPHYILMFNYLRECNGFYEVIINSDTRETMWIKKNSTIFVKSWEEFLQTVFCVSTLNPETNQVKVEPNDDSEIAFENIKDECWYVKEVKGEWLNIKCSDVDFDLTEEKYKNFTGWLKWRNDKELLIEYYMDI